MDDYDPEQLSRKWRGRLEPLLRETRDAWEASRPRKRLFSFGLPESDAAHDQQTPARDKATLLYHGRVVWGLFTRAFFPAYVPGRHVHYGSVVYSLDAHEPDSVFELAFRVNQLRRNSSPPPPGTETVAAAIRDDQSSFVRLRLPLEVEAFGEAYFANLCIHRTRLPLGYLHERLVPVLTASGQSEWCCLLPLRFWPASLRELWASGPPAYPPAEFAAMLKQWNIEP